MAIMLLSFYCYNAGAFIWKPTMISKNQLKLIRALNQKKYRKQHQLFLVQGEKNVAELLGSDFDVDQIFATHSFIVEHSDALRNQHVIETDEEQLEKASTLISNNAALAIVKMKQKAVPEPKGMMLALDGVSDPGNLGTIIRVADWYGITHIIASDDCADPYNPKTISATMGSFSRVHVSQVDLPSYLNNAALPIYGAYLGGENVHQVSFAKEGIILMGSESHGIRPLAGQHVTRKITIPAFGQAESLNVAMATGIILDNVRRGQ